MKTFKEYLEEKSCCGGATKEDETKFHKKLDKLVHKTFGKSPDEKKMEEDTDKDIEFHQQGLANANYKGPMATYHRKRLKSLTSLNKKLDDLIDSGKGYTGGSKEDREKRFDKFVSESKMSDVHLDISDALDRHIASLKNRRMDADTLGQHALRVGKKLAAKHGIAHEHAQKLVNDYVDGELK